MTLIDLITIIKGVLAFPDAIIKLIRLLEKTPQQKHDEIVSRITKEEEHFRDTGRPSA